MTRTVSEKKGDRRRNRKMKWNGRRKAKMGVRESKKGGRIKIGREGGKNLPREENKQMLQTNK